MAEDPTPPLPPDRRAALEAIPLDGLPSPAFVVHLGLLAENCRLLGAVRAACGARILLALKGFACHPAFPLLRRHLDGSTASGLHEALLASECFGGEVHVYSPGFSEADLAKLARIAHTLVFNSPRQLGRGARQLDGFPGCPRLGLRVNPGVSQVATELYNPCAPDSRLGVTREVLARALEHDPDLLRPASGLHFHALCEQDADALEAAADAFEAGFGHLFDGLEWLNFGGGQHITRPGYDTERLCRVVRRFRERYGTEVYLEPGEAVALHTGILAATVIDVVEAGGIRTAILDASATCHLPDVLEMPYRPVVAGAGLPGERAHDYRLGGPSCLAGDLFGDYSFEQPLRPGDRLRFLDMSHYTMVKTTTFNGVPLPAICLCDQAGNTEVVRRFGYADYRNRLG